MHTTIPSFVINGICLHHTISLETGFFTESELTILLLPPCSLVGFQEYTGYLACYVGAGNKIPGFMLTQ